MSGNKDKADQVRVCVFGYKVGLHGNRQEGDEARQMDSCEGKTDGGKEKRERERERDCIIAQKLL